MQTQINTPVTVTHPDYAATTRVTVEVTPELIKQGKRFSSDKNPIALAVVGHLKTGAWVVSASSVAIRYDGCAEDIELSQIAREFDARFDSGKKVEPISFELVIPTWAVRQPDN